MSRIMSSPTFLLAALVFFTATNLPANAQIIRRTLNVTGQLLCPNGTGGLPLNGTPVSLTCGNNILGQGVTNANGTFAISIPALLGLLGLPNCVIRANLSSAICPVLGIGNNVIVGTVNFIINFLAGLITGIFSALV